MHRCVVYIICALMLCAQRVTIAQATGPSSGKLTEVQAADLLSDVLTYYGDLSVSRADAMRSYIDQIGKSDDYRIRGKVPPPTTRMTFQEVYKSALLFVQQGGDRYADPSLARLTPNEQQQELDALQHFNLQQLLFLNTQRDTIQRMRAYLESINEFQGYLQWSAKHFGTPAFATTGPATRSSQAAADWLADQLSSARARAWERARAQGLSQEQFDEQWAQQVDKFSSDAEQRVQTVKTLGTFFHPRSTYQSPGATTTSLSGAAIGSPIPAPMPAGAVGNGVPLQAADPRWQANYYGPNNPYNTFKDDYSDVMRPSAGGGTYLRYDKRVNSDYDLRVQGEIDRRVNVSSDRRQNIRVDPRVNY